MNTTTPSASRTLAGMLMPLCVGTMAAGMVLLVVLHAHDVKWLGMDRAFRTLIAGLAIFAAVGTEMIVLRQKKLVGRGQVVEAVVDEVRSLAWSKEHSAAYYHFFTEDRRVITSYMAITNDQKESWTPGQKITAIYDPARPARHMVENRPWAVRWQAAA
jgi:hypothetical protein